jgi:hypothetical protein
MVAIDLCKCNNYCAIAGEREDLMPVAAAG